MIGCIVRLLLRPFNAALERWAGVIHLFPAPIDFEVGSLLRLDTIVRLLDLAQLWGHFFHAGFI